MVVQADWFKDWFNSPYYHKLYNTAGGEENERFIRRLLEIIKPAPGSFILDAGCGTGKTSRLLATSGFDVTGIDIAYDSITEAKKSESSNLHFFQHDMRLPFWMNYFDVALNLFTGFGYYKSEREHYNAIRTISNSLKPDGTFVLDYLNVHYAEDHLTHQSEKDTGDVNFILTKWFDETHFYKKIEIEDEQLEEPLIFQEKLMKFSLGDFTDMLAFHHLQIQEVFGDYNFGNYDVKKSPRLIMLAKKIHR
jgi:SAM-dependent methyltransferase